MTVLNINIKRPTERNMIGNIMSMKPINNQKRIFFVTKETASAPCEKVLVLLSRKTRTNSLSKGGTAENIHF